MPHRLLGSTKRSRNLRRCRSGRNQYRNTSRPIAGLFLDRLVEYCQSDSQSLARIALLRIEQDARHTFVRFPAHRGSDEVIAELHDLRTWTAMILGAEIHFERIQCLSNGLDAFWPNSR